MWYESGKLPKIMHVKKISIENAKQNKLFYFVANAIVYRDSDSRCLILKRDEREKVHPGRYAFPGGKLEWEDLDMANPEGVSGEVPYWDSAIVELLRREVLEETSVEIYDEYKYVDSSVFVRQDEIPVVLIKFAVRYKGGDIKLEEGAFTDYAWVDEDEVRNYDFVGDADKQIAETVKLMKR